MRAIFLNDTELAHVLVGLRLLQDHLADPDYTLEGFAEHLEGQELPTVESLETLCQGINFPGMRSLDVTLPEEKWLLVQERLGNLKAALDDVSREVDAQITGPSPWNTWPPPPVRPENPLLTVKLAEELPSVLLAMAIQQEGEDDGE